MTTAYTSDELDRMEKLFIEKLPRVPNETDLEELPLIDAISAAGSPFGMWVRLHLVAEQFVLLFLNPLVVLQMLHGINECAVDAGWWKGEVKYKGNDMPTPTAQSTNNANEVISMTTGSAGELMLLHFARRDGSEQMIGILKQPAIDLFLTIEHAGKQFGLWDDEFKLLPGENSQRITDLEILRAANQLSHQFPGNAKTVATERSHAAYAVGDMFNFEMWERVAKAVTDLTKVKPDNPSAIH